jgi:hypothetical protein
MHAAPYYMTLILILQYMAITAAAAAAAAAAIAATMCMYVVCGEVTAGDLPVCAKLLVLLGLWVNSYRRDTWAFSRNSSSDLPSISRAVT